MSLPLQPIPVDELRRADARWLLAYWKSKVFKDELPLCDSISLGEMRSVAADVMTLEPTGTAGEMRYRLVGAALTGRFGTNLAEKKLRLDSTGNWATAFQDAITARHPVALRGRVPGGDAGWANFEAIVLPLACEVPGGVSLLAGMFFFED